MAGLKQLKLKRETVNKTRKVTRAMEAVSAVKMRKAQERALQGRAYATGALRILENVAGSVGGHELFASREQGTYGLAVITSDKGMAGALNSAVLKRVSTFIREHDNVVAICIGRRGHEFVKARGVTVLHFEENRSDEVTEEDMNRITSIALAQHEEHATRSWHVAYTNFKSTFEQESALRQVLPLSREVLHDMITGIVPTHGKFADRAEQAQAIAYTVEPSAEDVLGVLVPTLVNVVLFHALLETKASEHSARMVAMKSATDKATEMSHALLLKFNKARQALITREVSEITSGIEAMK